MKLVNNFSTLNNGGTCWWWRDLRLTGQHRLDFVINVVITNHFLLASGSFVKCAIWCDFMFDIAIRVDCDILSLIFFLYLNRDCTFCGLIKFATLDGAVDGRSGFCRRRLNITY